MGAQITRGIHLGADNENSFLHGQLSPKDYTTRRTAMEFIDRTETTRNMMGTGTVTLTDKFGDSTEMTADIIHTIKTYEYQSSPGQTCKEQLPGFFEFTGPVEGTVEAFDKVDETIWCETDTKDRITVTGSNDRHSFTAHGYACRREGNRLVVRCENITMNDID